MGSQVVFLEDYDCLGEFGGLYRLLMSWLGRVCTLESETGILRWRFPWRGGHLMPVVTRKDECI